MAEGHLEPTQDIHACSSTPGTPARPRHPSSPARALRPLHTALAWKSRAWSREGTRSTLTEGDLWQSHWLGDAQGLRMGQQFQGHEGQAAALGLLAPWDTHVWA